MKLSKEAIEEFKDEKIKVVYETANLSQEEVERRLQSAFDMLFQLIEKNYRVRNQHQNKK